MTFLSDSAPFAWFFVAVVLLFCARVLGLNDKLVKNNKKQLARNELLRDELIKAAEQLAAAGHYYSDMRRIALEAVAKLRQVGDPDFEEELRELNERMKKE